MKLPKALQFLSKPTRLLAELLTQTASPNQIAWGFALGMLVGRVPKGNLTAWLLAVLVLATRANLAAAALRPGSFLHPGDFSSASRPLQVEGQVPSSIDSHCPLRVAALHRSGVGQPGTHASTVVRCQAHDRGGGVRAFGRQSSR